MENINPKTKANWLSLLFLTYTIDIFRKGSKNLWTNKNLYSPLDTHRSGQLGIRIEREWEKYVNRCKKRNQSPSVKRVLLKIFWPNLCFDGCLVFLHQLSKLPEPFLLGLFLSNFSERSTLIDGETCWYVALLIFFGGLRTVLFSQMRGSSHDTAVKVRSSCNSLILRKILRMSKSALQDKSSGNIVNLISNDLNRLDVTIFLIHLVWVIPISLFGLLYLLYYNLGLPGLTGVVWFTLPMLLQGYFANRIGLFRRKIAILTGERLKLINEMLTGIQIIKMYTWEQKFSKFINLSRISELEIIKKSNYFKFLIPSVASFVSVSAIFAAIFTMIKTNSNASVAQLYSLVAYYAFLNNNISQVLPLSIMRVAELHQTFSRIKTFMLSEEINYKKELSKNTNIPANVKITLENIHAQWVFQENQNTRFHSSNNKEEHPQTENTQLILKRGVDVIKDINLEVREKEFVGIVGPVGSGKSSLLSTILGETFVSTGDKFVNGSVSYASQEPWIFDGTIRENILFYQPFEQSRYIDVLRVCGLEKDISLFPNTDQTQVGERGVCLSGGQKARINLARAVYKKADIYLLDDPLSSLDIHVCNYLVAECFKKFLADKCRILVTHHLHYLEYCSQILVLNLGDALCIGSFQDLKQRGVLNVSDSNLEMEDDTYDVTESNIEKSNSISKIDENEKKTQTIKTKQTNKQKYFFAYLNSGGQSNFVIIVSSVFILCQLVDTSFYLFLGYWTNARELKHHNSSNLLEIKNAAVEWNNGIHIFSVLITVLGILSILRGICYCRMVIRNSKVLHSNMLDNTIGGKMQFFHQNTSGHILSWFSKDLGVVDEVLPRNVFDTSVQALSLSSRVLVVAFLNPYLILVIGIMLLVLPRLLRTYRNTARNISRIEGSSMAPVLTHVNAVIKGISTIRACQAEDIVIAEFDRHQDRYLTSWFMFATVFNAFGFSVDLISYLFISTVTVSCFLMHNAIGLNGSQIGLAITQAMGLATYLQYGLLQFVQTDNSLVALERILEYKKIPQEVKPSQTLKLLHGWPMDGKITFRNVMVKYDDDHPSVLKNLNFVIHPKEKIGIVGRTGAGKTSIISALFRMVPSIDGTIEIDDCDTHAIALDILRSHISIIPQDAVLFSATLRYNLDPFGECSDSDLYSVLKEVDLEKTGCVVRELHDKIEENGANLSVGQKQLINLARAILKKNKIVVLDEATSNIDSVTDDLIQSTIRRNFADCTLLTIAHRISTVMDSDRIMVIEAGELIQFDTPEILLKNQEGAFYKMVNQN